MFKAVKKHSLSASSLSGRSDGGGSGGDVLGLVLSLGLDRLGGFLGGDSLLGDRLLSLGNLLGGGSLLLLDGILLLGLLNWLIVRLGGSLALDGSTELGERALLLVALGSGAGRLVALAKVERQRRLALLLLLLLLGITIGRSNFGGLSRDGGGAGNIDGQGGGGLNGRDDGSSLSGGDLLLLGDSISGLASAAFFSFLEKTLPKKLVRLLTAGFSLGDSAWSSSLALVSPSTAGSTTAGTSSVTGASTSGTGSTTAGVSVARVSSVLASSFFSSFLPKPKKDVRLRLAERRSFSLTLSSSLAGSSLAASSVLAAVSSAGTAASSTGAASSLGASVFSSLGAGLKLSMVCL